MRPREPGAPPDNPDRAGARPWGRSLFDRRMLIVSGKGGVGRTTVAAALATAAARQGRRVLLAQMDAHERTGPLFGRTGPVGAEVVSMRPGIDAVNMNARAALREYGLMVLRYEAVYRALFENRPVRSFLSAVPGLDAYSMLGKAWFHTTEQHGGRPRYDLVVLDAPASGHAATMLRIPRAILDAMPRGPLARDAHALVELLTDPERAAFVVVTLAEELPASETGDLVRTVREVLGMPLGPLIVNAVPPAELAHPALGRVLDIDAEVAPELARTLASARLLRTRRLEAERLITRLQADTGLALVQLPRVFTAEMGEDALAPLTDGLGAL